MKIRTGFVSNSSSSSFVCDVCGNVESGMDMSASDFEMSDCVNGHTFCNCHAEKLLDGVTPENYREFIRNRIKDNKWREAEEKKELYRELDDTTNDDIEDLFNNDYSDEGVMECMCPICSFESINATDGYNYLKKINRITDKQILDEIIKRFKDYNEFKTFIKGDKK